MVNAAFPYNMGGRLYFIQEVKRLDRAGLRYADRMKHLNGSAIREIFKYMGRPGMISFAGGNPGSFALPDEQIACITYELLRTIG